MFLLRTRYDLFSRRVFARRAKGTPPRIRFYESERKAEKKGRRRAKPETSTVRNLFHEHSPLGQRKHFCEGSEVVFLACIARHRSWISCAAKPQATSFLVAIGIVAFFNVPRRISHLSSRRIVSPSIGNHPFFTFFYFNPLDLRRYDRFVSQLFQFCKSENKRRRNKSICPLSLVERNLISQLNGHR